MNFSVGAISPFYSSNESGQAVQLHGKKKTGLTPSHFKNLKNINRSALGNA